MTTRNIFLFSLALFIASLSSAFVYTGTGHNNTDLPFVVIGLILVFALNVGGVLVAFNESRDKQKGYTLGLIGNSTMAILFLALMITVVVNPQSLIMD